MTERKPADPILLKPPNYLLRIDALWAFVSVDAAGNEGLCAATLPGVPGVMPLIAADLARLQSLMATAREIARISGMRVRLIKLSTREELQVIGPDGKDEPGSPAGTEA